MKKVIKIKESKVLEIIDNIINEQASQPMSVSASNQLGTYPNFDGLKTLAKDLKANVERALRGSTPYRIKTDNPNGVAIARIQGSALKLIITLAPCKEEDRDWYFDLSLAIYSQINTTSFNVLTAKVMEKAAERGQAFVGSQGKIESLGRNHIQLDQLPNLDPNNPSKVFNLYVIYIAGARPKGYQRAELETGGEEQPKQNNQNAETPSNLKNVRSVKEGDVLYAIRSVDNQKYKLTFAPFKEGYDGFGVYITGPGTYEGKKLDGTVAYDLRVYSNKPDELQGNNEMGSFKLIASGEVTSVSTSTITNPEETKTTSEEEVIKKVSGKFTTNVADTAHNFKNLEDKLGPILEEMYNMGINPKITDLSATITKNGEQYTTIYRATVTKSNDGKAWMGFTSRGSINKDYIKRADGQIDGSENEDGRSLEEKLKGIGAGEIETITVYEDSKVPVKQYFVQFTKPKQFPPHK